MAGDWASREQSQALLFAVFSNQKMPFQTGMGEESPGYSPRHRAASLHGQKELLGREGQRAPRVGRQVRVGCQAQGSGWVQGCCIPASTHACGRMSLTNCTAPAWTSGTD